MDGYARFVTVHMLKNKSSEVVNYNVKDYVPWAERQAGRMIQKGFTFKVKQVHTVKDGKFVNEAMEARVASSTSKWDRRARS